nr:hypothetical protein [Micromonospora tarapacensis]
MLVQISYTALMPLHRLSATVGAEPQPRTGQVRPQPVIRVAVPTAPEEVGIRAGA